MSFRSLSLVGVFLAVAPGAQAAEAASPFGAIVPVNREATTLGKRLGYRILAHYEAQQAGLPFDLVDAVMKIESDYRPDRIGDVGEIGLMQVRPGTAAMLGFRGTAADLATPAVNIHYGATYLGQAWHLTHGNVCRTLMKYRAGHGEETMSALSASYCSRARAHLESVGSRYAAAITPADLVTAVTADVPPSARPVRSRTHFWAVFEARIKKINAKIEAKWRRMADR